MAASDDARVVASQAASLPCGRIRIRFCREAVMRRSVCEVQAAVGAYPVVAGLA
jgi:hypothetical protein